MRLRKGVRGLSPRPVHGAGVEPREQSSRYENIRSWPRPWRATGWERDARLLLSAVPRATATATPRRTAERDAASDGASGAHARRRDAQARPQHQAPSWGRGELRARGPAQGSSERSTGTVSWGSYPRETRCWQSRGRCFKQRQSKLSVLGAVDSTAERSGCGHPEWIRGTQLPSFPHTGNSSGKQLGGFVGAAAGWCAWPS
eukprot:scaffold2527_cov337-Prasinococcus_capsulatus_cf.AAC.6